MKKLINLFSAVILTMSLAFSFSSCQPEKQKTALEKIKENGYITVATSGNQFPFTFREGDKLKGIDISIAEVIAQEMGLELKFVEVELGDIIAAVKDGKADIAISGLSITAERNMDVMFAGPYFETGKSILSSNPDLVTGDPMFVNNADVKLAVVDKSSSLEYAKKHYPNATILTFEGIRECKNALYSGEVNGMLADYEICEAYYYDPMNKGEYNFRSISSIEEHELIGIATANDPMLQNTIENLIKHIRKGKIEQVVEETWLNYLN